jgi:hypothetical protein
MPLHPIPHLLRISIMGAQIQPNPTFTGARFKLETC